VRSRFSRSNLLTHFFFFFYFFYMLACLNGRQFLFSPTQFTAHGPFLFRPLPTFEGIPASGYPRIGSPFPFPFVTPPPSGHSFVRTEFIVSFFLPLLEQRYFSTFSLVDPVLIFRSRNFPFCRPSSYLSQFVLLDPTPDWCCLLFCDLRFLRSIPR